MIPRPIQADFALAALGIGTVAASTLAWGGLMELPARFLVPLAIIALGLVAAGIAIRRARLPRLVGVVLEIVTAFCLYYFMVAPSPMDFGSSGLVGAWRQALDSVQTYSAPVPAGVASIAPVLIGAGTALFVLADLLVTWLRRPALLGLVLLVVQVVPFLVLGKPSGLVAYVVTAAGYLALLALDRSAQLGRWGHGVVVAGVAEGSAPELAFGVGASAIAFSVVGALILPTWSLQQWGEGVGSSGTGKNISIENPITDLQRDLRRGADQPLLQVVTDDPDPSYLRIAVLTRFRNATWSTGDRTFPSGQEANGRVSDLAGAQSGRPKPHTYSFTAFDAFNSTWLPTPTTLTEIYAPGKWKYDSATMDFLAAEDGLTVAGLDYRALASPLRPTADQLAKAAPPPAGISNRYLSLPTDLPSLVGELADTVASGQPTKFQEAQALQQWFRKDGGFTYSLRTESGSGTAALVRFLSAGDGGRVGYCEQFASAMAVMARARGIPARVAVGFLTPERVGPQSFEYSSHDLHAWPELYFSGVGWVRFEPTPAARANAPGYSTERLPEIPLPTASPSASELVPSRAPAADATPPRNTSSTETGSSRWPLWAASATVLGLASIGLPAVVRRRRRGRRLSSGDVELAWLELRDLCVDLGRPWPGGRSPRQIGEVLVGWLGADDKSAGGASWQRPLSGADVNPMAEIALQKLVSWWEVRRYSADDVPIAAEELRATVEECAKGLIAGTSPRESRRARLWPRSVFMRQPVTGSSARGAQRETARMEDSLSR